MKLFRSMYDKVLKWASHRHADYYLAGVSFVESSFFPIPPDVMLIPMVLNRPFKMWHYAFITTLFSILGGILGYLIGYFAYEWLVEPYIVTMGYEHAAKMVKNWFDNYGVFAVMLAGFTPIPYKLFTLTAGATQMSIGLFILGSIIGRASRFYLVAVLVSKLGKRMEALVLRYIETIGWLTLLMVAIGVIGYQWYYA